MIPSLTRLSEVPAIFEDTDGAEVARLEYRSANTVALVGVKCGGECIITVPMPGKKGYAHIELCDKKGVCRSANGVSLCASVVKTLHSRGAHVVFSVGYASVFLIRGAATGAAIGANDGAEAMNIVWK